MNIELALYDDWNIKKKELAVAVRELLFKEGEVWWCSLGLNIGTETYGKGKDFLRPILIIKKLSKEDCIALPITSVPKSGDWYAEVIFNEEKRWIMLHQIRIVHIKRFMERISVLSETDLIRVKKDLKQLLEV